MPGCCLSKAKKKRKKKKIKLADGKRDEYIRNIDRDAIIIIYISS